MRCGFRVRTSAVILPQSRRSRGPHIHEYNSTRDALRLGQSDGIVRPNFEIRTAFAPGQVVGLRSGRGTTLWPEGRRACGSPRLKKAEDEEAVAAAALEALSFMQSELRAFRER